MTGRPLYRDTFTDWPDFVGAIVKAELGMPADPRLVAAAGTNEGIPSDGGFLVPDGQAAAIWTAATAQGELLGRVARQPVTVGDGIRLPAIDETSRADGSRQGGVRAYWANEADTVAASRPRFRQLGLQPKKLMAIAWATDELVRDTMALGSWLERTLTAEMTFMAEDSIMNGSGVGQPLGIVASPATIVVAAEGGQAAGTVTTTNVKAMLGRLWVGSRRNAVWLINPDHEPALEVMETTAGAPLYSYGADGTARLLGRPVIPVEYCAPVGSVGDIVLADLSQYLLAEKEPDIVSSIHLRFMYGETAFKARWRFDGQSGWASPITPKNSSTTQSPFVTLAARA